MHYLAIHMSTLLMLHNRFSKSENEVVEAHTPQHRDSKTKKQQHGEKNPKKPQHPNSTTKTP